MGVGLGCYAEPKQEGSVRPVTLPIGLQDWNHRFAVNLSHEAQICDSIDLFRRDLDPSALRLEVRFCKAIAVVTSYKHRIMNATFSP